jgi:uncharacterized membrane protein YbaN (DUF454 family)
MRKSTFIDESGFLILKTLIFTKSSQRFAFPKLSHLYFVQMERSRLQKWIPFGGEEIL